MLIATAIFGIATAGLFMAFAPTHEALFRLSNLSNDAGDLEIAKAFAADAKDRDTLLSGADATLPDGRTLRWRAELTPTDTEALFRVRLTAEREGEDALTAEYLHFEPRWLQPTDEKPRWLTHAGASSGSSAPNRPGQGGSKPGDGKPGSGKPGDGRPQKPGGGESQGAGKRPSPPPGTPRAQPASGGKR